MIVEKNDIELMELFHWKLIKSKNHHTKIYAKSINNHPVKITIGPLNLGLTIYKRHTPLYIVETNSNVEIFLDWYYNRYGMLSVLNFIYTLCMK